MDDQDHHQDQVQPLSPPFSRGVLLPTTLQEAKITTLPSTAYYIPNFISPDEEALILDRIHSAPKPRWKQLSHRRLQTWPSDLVNNNTLLDSPLPSWLTDPIISRLLSIPTILSSASSSLSDSLDPPKAHLFSDSPHQKPNHVLINEYPPGTGIMPHKDGPAYHPIVCTISLASSLCLHIHKPQDGADGAIDPEPAFRILQEPRSLLITTGSLYDEYLHGIGDIETDVGLGEDTVANWDLLRNTGRFEDGTNTRDVRLSLTYRDVLKVSKLGNKFGMFLKR